MASTPLYKAMKERGTSFYAFPGAGDDIATAYQNQNNKMYFSKYTLVNIPIDNSSTADISPKFFNFDDAFERSSNSTSASRFSERLVESLRNYVANHEVTMKESRINNTDYFYDQNLLSTPSEKIFWKWARKLNLIEFEPANVGDEYFGNLIEFERNNNSDETYFPELLWRERKVVEFGIIDYYETDNLVYINKLEIEFGGSVNYKVGDIVTINIDNYLDYNVYVLYVYSGIGQRGQRIIVDIASTLNSNPSTHKGTCVLVYEKFVKYIGEVNGTNNVQEANRSYTEVYAHIPDHTGQTPDILFRTLYDANYSPNLQFPIQPSQIQPEIVGAEIYSNPIVSSPQNYPGDYYGQFDTEFYTYETSSGDVLRRSGDYFGIKGSIGNPIFDGSEIDGINIDFDVAHYVKMNVVGEEVTNFDQFNAMVVNGEIPKDFEYNAIMWYYTVEDNAGNQSSNLYGISFVDSPSNNDVMDEVNLKIQSVKKLVANDDQDGTAFMYSVNLNYNIVNDNPQDTFNPEAINSLFSFNLYNEAMRKLSVANDSFMKVITKQGSLSLEFDRVKQLIYTQSDLNVINSKIDNLSKLLNLYQTNQMESSNTIEVLVDNSTSPPQIRLNSKDNIYERCDVINTSDMYTTSGALTVETLVPNHKGLLIKLINDDTIKQELGDSNLMITLSKDLSYTQSVTIILDASDASLENKKLDVFINREAVSNNGEIYYVKNKILGDINLPIYSKSGGDKINVAKWMHSFDYNIRMDDSYQMEVSVSGRMDIALETSYDIGLTKGDVLYLDNFIINNGGVKIDLSDQYSVYTTSIKKMGDSFSYIITLDVSTNDQLVNTIGVFNSSNSINRLVCIPKLRLNKGSKIIITKIGDGAVFSDIDYLIEIEKY
jgi:hypothetical protein